MSSEIENPATGMELSNLLEHANFLRRSKHAGVGVREADALRRLARVFANAPDTILQELVNIALDVCGADSTGISLEEKDEAGQLRFRWVAVAGSFSKYLNGTTPRFFSPCGTCLERGTAQYYRVTKPYYDFLGIEAEPITDGILIPWAIDSTRGTLWAVAHNSAEAFDHEDYRMLDDLADFAAIAIRHHVQQENFRRREKEAASAALANQLAHEINNPLQALTNAVYLAQHGHRSATSLNLATKELTRLSELVRNLLKVSAPHS